MPVSLIYSHIYAQYYAKVLGILHSRKYAVLCQCPWKLGITMALLRLERTMNLLEGGKGGWGREGGEGTEGGWGERVGRGRGGEREGGGREGGWGEREGGE